MKKHFIELIGTFALTLVLQLTYTTAATYFAPFIISAALFGLATINSKESYAHFNPAISLAGLLSGKMSVKNFLLAIVSQFLGAFLGSWVAYQLSWHIFAPHQNLEITGIQALSMESIFSALLALAFFNTMCTDREKLYPLVYSLIYLIALYVSPTISGGTFNPAIGLGCTLVTGIMEKFDVSDLWLYILGPILGSIIGYLLNKFLYQRNIANDDN